MERHAGDLPRELDPDDRRVELVVASPQGTDAAAVRPRIGARYARPQLRPPLPPHSRRPRLGRGWSPWFRHSSSLLSSTSQQSNLMREVGRRLLRETPTPAPAA